MNTTQIISRDDVMREWRDSLIEQMGSEVLADAHIRFAQEEAARMRAHHAELHTELQTLDTGLAKHLLATAARLAPLREVADHLRREADEAFTRLETARIAFEAECYSKFRNRMNEIREELGRPYSPVGPKASNWKHAPASDTQPRNN